MIDVKEAVQIAKQKAAEILGEESASLEEIDRKKYNDRDSWGITLGVLRDLNQLSPFDRISKAPVKYRVFYIDAQSGELLAMKLHELASR